MAMISNVLARTFLVFSVAENILGDNGPISAYRDRQQTANSGRLEPQK